MTTHTGMIGIILAGAVGLAGCSSAGSTSGVRAANIAPSATTSATATPTPTPATLTMAEARAAYRRIVKPINDDITAANKIMTGTTPQLTAMRRIARRARLDDHMFAINLRSALWPADVRPIARKLADAEAGEVSIWTAIGEDRTWSAVQADWSRFTNGGSREDRLASLVEQFREAVGLPPAR